MSITTLIEILFALGCILLAVGLNTPQTWGTRVGSILMAIAATVWLFVPGVGHLH